MKEPQSQNRKWAVLTGCTIFSLLIYFLAERQAHKAPSSPDGYLPSWKKESAGSKPPEASPKPRAPLPIELEVIDWRFRLNPKLVDALKLDDLQRSKLHAAIDKAYKELKKIESEHCLAENTEEASFLFIPRFPEEGAKIKASFEAELTEAVGQQKAVQVLKASASALEMACGGFGEKARIIRIRSRTPTESADKNGTYHADVWSGLFVEQTFRNLATEGARGFFMGGSQRAIVFQEMPEEFRPFWEGK